MDDITLNELEYNPDQQIFEYLRGQEDAIEYPLEDLIDIDKELKTNEVRGILDCIIGRIEDRAKRKEEHEAKVKSHNQYPLFDLATVIKDAFIDEEIYHKLIFRETLIISKVNKNKSLTAVGGMCLDIQSAKGTAPLIRKFQEESFTDCLNLPKEDDFWGDHVKREAPTVAQLLDEDDEDSKNFTEEVKKKLHRNFTKFLVHLHSQLDVNGKNGGSKVSAWVDRNLHTLEEKRKEFIVEEGENLREKTLYVALQKGKYFIKYKSRPDNTREKKFYSFPKTKHFVGEGASFVLMRFLAVYKFYGMFEMSTMYINGDMCRNIYMSNGPEGGAINGRKVDLCRIYRIVIEECGLEHRSHTLLTLTGQIIKHEWEDCNYVIHVNPLATISNKQPESCEEMQLKNVWQQDMQLFSMYLDEKNTTSLLIRSYLLDHPELNNMVADYIQHILTLKPTDILEFTINHFKNFTPHLFPRNDYYDTTQVEEEEIFTI